MVRDNSLFPCAGLSPGQPPPQKGLIPPHRPIPSCGSVKKVRAGRSASQTFHRRRRAGSEAGLRQEPNAQGVEAVAFTLKSQRPGIRPFSLAACLARRPTWFPAENTRRTSVGRDFRPHRPHAESLAGHCSPTFQRAADSECAPV